MKQKSYIFQLSFVSTDHVTHKRRVQLRNVLRLHYLEKQYDTE